MKKRILCLLCVLALLTGTVPAALADGPEPDRMCSLTLTYSREGTAFEGLQIQIYRVAQLNPDGTYDLLEPFSGYPIQIYGITSQSQWQDTAQTIRNYILSDGVEPYRTASTGEDGIAFFGELQTGLYMVMGVTGQDGNTIVMFRDFMIYLPTPAEDDYDYDVQAKPKATSYVPPERYTVVKLWKDDDPEDRPDGIDVEIRKDGTLHEQVRLDDENDWSHSWEAPDDDSEWSVVEINVPEGYQVSITRNDTVFRITNTFSRPTDPENPDPEVPSTGDTTPVMMYLILMCLSGCAMVCLGVMWSRDRNDEKKR